VANWRNAARGQRQKLSLLLDTLHAVPVPEPVSAHEALIEYDRRRVLKEQLLYTAISACLDSSLAVGALEGALQSAESGRSESGAPGGKPVAEANWGPLAIRLESALFRGDVGEARAALPAFLELFKAEPLLFQPLGEG